MVPTGLDRINPLALAVRGVRADVAGSLPMMGIEFTATIYKVATLVDGGLRVTLDLPESAIAEAAALMECKRRETPLKVSAHIILTKPNNETKEKAKDGSPEVDSRRLGKR